MNHTLLSFNDTDLEAGELGFHYHVVHVKAIECFRSILASCTQLFQCQKWLGEVSAPTNFFVEKDRGAARVHVLEACYIIDLSVYDDPLQ